MNLINLAIVFCKNHCSHIETQKMDASLREKLQLVLIGILSSYIFCGTTSFYAISCIIVGIFLLLAPPTSQQAEEPNQTELEKQTESIGNGSAGESKVVVDSEKVEAPQEAEKKEMGTKEESPKEPVQAAEINEDSMKEAETVNNEGEAVKETGAMRTSSDAEEAPEEPKNAPASTLPLQELKNLYKVVPQSIKDRAKELNIFGDMLPGQTHIRLSCRLSKPESAHKVENLLVNEYMSGEFKDQLLRVMAFVKEGPKNADNWFVIRCCFDTLSRTQSEYDRLDLDPDFRKHFRKSDLKIDTANKKAKPISF